MLCELVDDENQRLLHASYTNQDYINLENHDGGRTIQSPFIPSSVHSKTSHYTSPPPASTATSPDGSNELLVELIDRSHDFQYLGVLAQGQKARQYSLKEITWTPGADTGPVRRKQLHRALSGAADESLPNPVQANQGTIDKAILAARDAEERSDNIADKIEARATIQALGELDSLQAKPLPGGVPRPGTHVTDRVSYLAAQQSLGENYHGSHP